MENSAAIKANAEIVIKTFAEKNNVKLAYDQASVIWIDGYIERNRQTWDESSAEKLINVLGSFLGECLRRNYGGAWQMTEMGLCISFAEGNAAFPFNKIKKQIKNGTEDSIASFYNSISILFKQ